MASTSRASSTVTASFFEDLVRCETRLYNALGERLRREHDGLQTSQFMFLRYLDAHPDARVADIAQTFAIGIGATSKAIDRHEQAGRVRRDPNPEDRRSSLLNLTDAGARLLAAAERTFDACMAELLHPVVAPADLRAAATSLAALRAALELGRHGVPAG